MSEVTAEIDEGMTWSGEQRWILQMWTDRKPAARGGLTKGKRGGMLVGDTLPGLLRSTADYMEQESIDSLHGLAAALPAVRGENP
jgi:hypothetical protein